MKLLSLFSLPPATDLGELLNKVEIRADCPDSLTIASYVCLLNNLPKQAQALIDQSLALQPGNPDSHYISGLVKSSQAVGPHAAWGEIRDGAREAIRVAEQLYGDNIQHWDLLERVLGMMANMCLMIGPDDLAFSASERLVSLFPEDAAHHQTFSTACANTGRSAQALQHLLKSNQLAPSQQKETELADLRSILLATSGRVTRASKGRYPSTEEMRSDLKKVISAYVINEIDSKTFGFRLCKETKIFTMGSCFAREISQRLRGRGFDSFHLEVGEYINSTYANTAMLEWAEGRLKNEANLKRINDLLLPLTTPEQLIKQIESTSLFIYTLGVAPCFFDRKTGDFVMPRASSINNHALAEVFNFRTTRVSENVANLRVIIAFVRRLNPSAKFVITLSPVPLKVTFERGSAVQADCLSKSTLRLAAEEVVSEDPENIVYWPSFEIVKWLGGHVGPFYGVDDGAAWHVSAAVIQLITDLFIDRFETR